MGSEIPKKGELMMTGSSHTTPRANAERSGRDRRRLGLAVLLVAMAALMALVPSIACAMPASPALLDRASHDPALAARLAAQAQQAKAAGVDAPRTARIIPPSGITGAPARVEKAVPSTGSLNTLVLLVEFSDRAATTEDTFFDDLVFGDYTGPESVRGYYKEVSYGALDVVTDDAPSTIGWLTLPHTAAYYAGVDNGTSDNYPNNAQKMVEDAVDQAALAGLDFAPYDVNSDGFVDNLVIVHAGSGAEMTDSATDIWSHAWEITPRTFGSVQVSSYSTVPEFWNTSGDMTVGVYTHEIGHTLGLPDLYDRDYSSEGVGDWSLMAGGSWNGPAGPDGYPLGGSPSRLDAWSSSQLGWLEPQLVTTPPTTKQLPSVGTTSTASAYKIYPQGASSGTEYFLIENRQMTGTDSYLPGDGVLIWHVDETKNNYLEQNDDETHKLVDLEEADGLPDMDIGLNRGTAGDPFPGTSDNRAFSDSTDPNAMTYADEASDDLVDQISDSSEEMTARIGVTTGMGILTGRVVDSNGDALQDASVVLGDLDPAITDGDGYYSLFADPGTYDLTFSLAGYTSKTISDVIIEAGETTTKNAVLDVTPDPVTLVYRFFNKEAGVHFYTASYDEYLNVVQKLGYRYQYDGVAYSIGTDDPRNNKPLYRFFNMETGVHFYTVSEAEKANVIAKYSKRYKYEGVAYMVSDDPSGMPVHRFYNPARNAHFYSLNTSEIFGSLSDHYVYEGIGYYVIP